MPDNSAASASSETDKPGAEKPATNKPAYAAPELDAALWAQVMTAMQAAEAAVAEAVHGINKPSSQTTGEQ